MPRRTLLWIVSLASVLVGLAVGTGGHPLRLLRQLHVMAAAADTGEPAAALAPIPPLPDDSLVIADSAHRRCGPLSGVRKSACYDAFLLQLVNDGKVRLALGALHRLGTVDEDVARASHEYAHAIGMNAYRPGRDVGAVFESCTEIFQSGCYHGVIQTYLASAPHVGPAEVNAVCKRWVDAGTYSWLRFQCMHGMGHGLTMYLDHDLPKALALCDDLPEQWDRRSCYGGAFMENIVHATEAHDSPAALARGDTGAAHTAPTAPMAHMDHVGPMAHVERANRGGAPAFRAYDPNDLQYPCSVVGERYKRDCYTMQAAVVLQINGGDFAATARACDEAPPRYRYPCYQGIGTDVSGSTLRDHDESIRLCGLGNPRYAPWCYRGVVKNYIDVTAKLEDGFAFCRELHASDNKAMCYESVGEEAAVLHPQVSDRRGRCDPAEPEFVDACRFGAQLIPTPPATLPKADTTAAPASTT